MRRLVCIILIAVALTGCDSSTEPEQPKLRTGASADLAIELPLIFPPDPRQAQIITEWSVITGGKIWFHNEEDDAIALTMRVRDPRTGETDVVGKFDLAPFDTRAMPLDDEFTTNQYKDHSWTLDYRSGPVIETIVVGFAD